MVKEKRDLNCFKNNYVLSDFGRKISIPFSIFCNAGDDCYQDMAMTLYYTDVRLCGSCHHHQDAASRTVVWM